MKIALVHDYLIQQGGAENVFKVFAEIFPEAPIYTFFYDAKKFKDILNGRQVYSSWLQKIPGITRHYRWTLPFMPKIIESFDFNGYDVVLSSTSAFGKGIIVGPKTTHICYCHTPTRYLWIESDEYVAQLRYGRLIKKIIFKLLNNLRQWDLKAAARVDFYLANSQEVEERIKKYYHRESTVIYPAVDVEKFIINPQVEIDPAKGYYLIGGRLVAYKRYDLAVQAFSRMGIKLKIFGSGPEENNLKQMAKPCIEFLGRVSEDTKRQLLASCIAFIHPQVEDFGITPLESMAAGRPVIAYRAGGALESVEAGLTGEFFDQQTWESLAETVIRFTPEKFNSIKIHEYVKKFDVARFKQELKQFIINHKK